MKYEIIVDFGNLTDWISAIGTIGAAVVALWLGLRKDPDVHFNVVQIGNLFYVDKNAGVTKLEIQAIYTGYGIKPIWEAGIIVCGDFRKINLMNTLMTSLNNNGMTDISFKNDAIIEHCPLNPFMSNKKMIYKLYVKDSAGKVYKSKNWYKITK